MKQPFLQGRLDYFCGLYSIANSLKKITDRTFNQYQPTIFARLLEKLIDLKAIYNIERKGIACSTMQRLFPVLKRLLHNDYDIDIEVLQPFSNEYVTIDNIKEYLGQKNSTVLLAIQQNRGMKHWSSVRSINKKAIMFDDSWVWNSIKLSEVGDIYEFSSLFIIRRVENKCQNKLHSKLTNKKLSKIS